MKSQTWVRASASLALAATAGFTAPAAATIDSGWYVGGNLGISRAEIDDARIVGGLLAGGFATTSINDDDQELGYKVFGGYQFAPYFAIEGGYFDLGTFGFTANTVPAGTLRGSIDLQGINLDAVFLLPITDWFSLFARGGANYAEAKDHFSGTGAVNVANPDRRQRDTNYKYGAGLQFALTERLGLRAEAERYRIDDAVGNMGDIDLFSAGLLYRFGAGKPVADPVVATPVAPPVAPPVVAAAPPPPPPPARPPPPQPTRVSFSADSLFDFNRADIKPAGRQELDDFAAKLRGMSFDVITVTGHSDRIGKHDYNMRLSSERAEAVKAYLVQSAGVAPGKIQTRGVDGAEPVTRPGDCNGREKPRASPELIACLQPDRRVEVEVSGTR